MNDTRAVTHRPAPPPRPRKIVQITAVPGADNGESSIYALCDDGTLWALSHSGQWHELPAIPQNYDEVPA
jgi:hypothetical protein